MFYWVWFLMSGLPGLRVCVWLLCYWVGTTSWRCTSLAVRVAWLSTVSAPAETAFVLVVTVWVTSATGLVKGPAGISQKPRSWLTVSLEVLKGLLLSALVAKSRGHGSHDPKFCVELVPTYAMRLAKVAEWVSYISHARPCFLLTRSLTRVF